MTTPTQGEHAQPEALRQILLDPENQPNQYGVQFLMHGPKMAFKIGVRQFTLDYEPDEPGEFEFMRDALIAAFSVFTPDVKTAQPAAPQGGAYAELPAAGFHCKSAHGAVAYIHDVAYQDGPATPIYNADQMRDFADRTHALRASHGQAPAGATVAPFCQSVSLDQCKFTGLCVHCAPTAQPAPAATPPADSTPSSPNRPSSAWYRQKIQETLDDDFQIGPAPQADSQPAPVRDYPPLPEPDLGMPWRVNAKSDGAVHSSGFTCEQMRAYVDADRAASAPADSVTAPAGGVVADSEDVQRARHIAAVAQRWIGDRTHLGALVYLDDLAWALKTLAAAPTPAAQGDA